VVGVMLRITAIWGWKSSGALQLKLETSSTDQLSSVLLAISRRPTPMLPPPGWNAGGSQNLASQRMVVVLPFEPVMARICPWILAANSSSPMTGRPNVLTAPVRAYRVGRRG